MKKSKLLKNFSYSFVSNVFSMLLGACCTLIIPRFIGVDAFGYYQLYLFYGSFAILFALGWGDGNYLCIGGTEYNNLDKRVQSSQFWMLTGCQIVLFVILLLFAMNENDLDRKAVLILTCICSVIIQSRYYLYLMLQATNRIKEYSIIIITERTISVLMSVAVVLLGYNGYIWLIFFDIVGRFSSLCVGMWFCRDIIKIKPCINNKLFLTIKNNISAGIMVLFSTLASSIVIGISRFAVENYWGITMFSKISLTISISNMATRCINAFGIVMFPALRQTEKEKLPIIYQKVNSLLMLLLFFLFIFYLPAARLLEWWLPKYSDSVRYAAILLPVCAFECKNAMLISTYLKTLRKERILAISNAVAILVSAVMTMFTVYIFHSVEMTMLSILIALMVRCILGELSLQKELHLQLWKFLLLENIMLVVFILCNWYMGLVGAVIYAAAYILYFFISKRVCKIGDGRI